MPCGCFGKKSKPVKDKFGKPGVNENKEPPYTTLNEKNLSYEAAPTLRASDGKTKPDDDVDNTNRRRDVVASYYSDKCELIQYKPTGSRPGSAYTSADTVPLLEPPPSPPAATSSPAQSSPTSSRSGASCRAELAEKRREFFRELNMNGMATPLSSTLPSAGKLNNMNNRRPNSHPSPTSEVTTRTLFNGQVQVNLKSAKLPRGNTPGVSEMDEDITNKENTLNSSQNESYQKPPTPPPPYEGEIYLDKNIRNEKSPSKTTPKHLKSKITSEELKSVHLKPTPPIPPQPLIMTDEEWERKEMERIKMEEKDNELFSLIESQEITSKEDIEDLMNIIDSPSIPIESEVSVNEELTQQMAIVNKKVEVTVKENIEEISQKVNDKVDVKEVEVTLQETIPDNIPEKIEPPSIQDTLMNIAPPPVTEVHTELSCDTQQIDDYINGGLNQTNGSLSPIMENDIENEIIPDVQTGIDIQREEQNININVETSIPSAEVQMEGLDSVSTTNKISIDTEANFLPQMGNTDTIIPTEIEEIIDLETPHTSEEVSLKNSINQATQPEMIINAEDLNINVPEIAISQVISNPVENISVISESIPQVVSTVQETIIDPETKTETTRTIITKESSIITTSQTDGDFDSLLDKEVTMGTPVVTQIIRQTVQVDNDSDIPKLTNINILESCPPEEVNFIVEEVEDDESENNVVPLIVEQGSLQHVIDRTNGMTAQHLANEIVNLQGELNEDPINSLISGVTDNIPFTVETTTYDDEEEDSEIPQLINFSTGHVLESDQQSNIEQIIDDVRLGNSPKDVIDVAISGSPKVVPKMTIETTTSDVTITTNLVDEVKETSDLP